MTQQEFWMPMYGGENDYEVSTYGKIRSIDRVISKADNTIQTLKGKTLRQNPSSNGYMMVNVKYKGVRTNKTVHSILAETFIVKGKMPKDRCVNHKDGVKSNNNISNIEVVSYAENLKHAHVNGLNNSIGETHYMAKATTNDIAKIREMYKNGVMQKDIAKIYNMKQPAISAIVNYKKRVNG